jgi:hypothetical protein
MKDAADGQVLVDASREYAEACFATLEESDGARPLVVVLACARMAGSHLFRSFDLTLTGVEPGQVVLSAEADQHMPLLMRTTADALDQLGVALTNTPLAIASNDRDQRLPDFLTTQRRLQPAFATIQSKHELTFRQSSRAAAIATAMLVHSYAGRMDPNAAFGIAMFGFVEGMKTAPDPVSYRVAA